MVNFYFILSANTDVWIDGNDIVAEDQWQFSDGSDVEYFRWADGQPSHLVFILFGPEEDCLSIQNSGFGSVFDKMDDEVCSNQLPYFCEIHLYA